MPQDSMSAFRIHRFGGPETVQRDSIPVPQPRPATVVVRVQAAGVNPVDIKTRSGVYPMVRESTLPFTLGRDVAGVIESVGADVAGWKPGDRVFAFVGQGQGTFAAYAEVPADALAQKPRTLDFAVAATVPLVALTAWQGLFDHGKLERGERVLIHAGAGGIGHFAVQFAKAKGAEIFTTASGEGIEMVRSLGIDNVINHRAQRFEDVVGQVDLVFDLVGGEIQERSWSVVRPGGALISTLAEPSPAQASSRGARGERYTCRPDGAQLAEIGSMIDEGAVRVIVTERFAFDDTPAALARVEKGHVHGKVVVAMQPAATA